MTCGPRSFRSYLRGALRLFLLERHREASAQKRGGGRAIVPLEDGEAVKDLQRELAASGRDVYFRVFDPHELSPPAGGYVSDEGEVAEELYRLFSM